MTTKNCICSLTILFVTAITALATPPLTITKSGYYLTYLNEAGVPTLEKINIVVDLTTTTPTTPVPVPPPPAPKPKVDLDLTVVKDAEAWGKVVDDPTGAQALSLVYDQVMGAQQDGLVDAVTVWSVLKVATDQALLIIDSKKDWKSFRDKLSSLVTLARQKGTLNTTESITILLNSLRQGLEQAAEGSTTISLPKAVSIAAKTNEVINDSRK